LKVFVSISVITIVNVLCVCSGFNRCYRGTCYSGEGPGGKSQVITSNIIMHDSRDGGSCSPSTFKLNCFTVLCLNILFCIDVIGVSLCRIAERHRHAQRLVDCISSEAVKVCTDVLFLLSFCCRLAQKVFCLYAKF